MRVFDLVTWRLAMLLASDSTNGTCLRGLDLFCGVGGSSRGATLAGVEMVAAIDIWKLAKESYRDNFPTARFYETACEDLEPAEIRKEVGDIDVLLASPECTSHTCAKGSARRSEKSRETAFQVTRFAECFLPRWIIVENVVHMRSWRRYASWIKSLRHIGYSIRQQVLNAADFGVPQSRRRLFIICDRLAEPPLIKPTSRIRRSASTIIDKTTIYPMSPLKHPRRAKATLARASRAIDELGAPEQFLIVYYGSDAAGGWQKIESPLRTITTLDRFAYIQRDVDDYSMRMLQVPELKRAMGFGADHLLDHGTRRDKIKLLGNAVCPPVMRALVRQLTGTSR